MSKTILPVPVWVYYSLLCSFCRESFQLTLLLFQPLNCTWTIKYKWRKELLIVCSCLDFFFNKTFHRRKEGGPLPWASLCWCSQLVVQPVVSFTQHVALAIRTKVLPASGLMYFIKLTHASGQVSKFCYGTHFSADLFLSVAFPTVVFSGTDISNQTTT